MPSRENAPGRADTPPRDSFAARAGKFVALAGLILYAVFAPHSIAGAWVGLSFAALASRRLNLRRTTFDLPLWLFFGWTLVSILLSEEPRLSAAKLPNVLTFLVFYVAQAALTRRLAVALAALLILSGAAGVVWSLCEVAVGRGVVVEAFAPESPFRREMPQLQTGDAIWRVGRARVSSVAEIDDALRGAPVGTRLQFHVITRGEHVVWDGPVVTDELKTSASPSGLQGTRPTRRFRASGWTRHYETYAELLQMLAQLALGFALAALQRRAPRRFIILPAAAFGLLAIGVALTAMRTVMVAFAVGALVVAWRAAARGRARLYVLTFVLLVLALGAFAVWRARPAGALRLQDDSASMRLSVAAHALGRVPLHPIFGHGMDSFKLRWEEWGFPLTEKIHFHSTWVQLAFDRGIPALALWLLLLYVFWRQLARAETLWRDTDDFAAHGFTLGASGALAGFFASSLVNYNFGDAEVALLLWWLMAASVAVSKQD